MSEVSCTAYSFGCQKPIGRPYVKEASYMSKVKRKVKNLTLSLAKNAM